ncbi:MAG: NnrU family protein, partial [Pseudorhodoplanes sp.]
IAVGFARYRATEWVNLWYPPVWTRHLALLLNWIAIVCIAAAYIPGHIKRVLKHPMLVGVKLWALAHLIANGDLGSLILFGSILAWAVYDRITLKRRTDPGAPSLPQGGWPSDLVAVVVGTVVYVALVLLFHPIIIGVPVIFG